jgi:hypothetical protein
MDWDGLLDVSYNMLKLNVLTYKVQTMFHTIRTILHDIISQRIPVHGLFCCWLCLIEQSIDLGDSIIVEISHQLFQMIVIKYHYVINAGPFHYRRE